MSRSRVNKTTFEPSTVVPKLKAWPAHKPSRRSTSWLQSRRYFWLYWQLSSGFS